MPEFDRLFGPTLKRKNGGRQVYFSSTFPLSESSLRFFSLIDKESGLRAVWLELGAVGYKKKFDVRVNRKPKFKTGESVPEWSCE